MNSIARNFKRWAFIRQPFCKLSGKGDAVISNTRKGIVKVSRVLKIIIIIIKKKKQLDVFSAYKIR